ncbi:hypothetical protein EYE40_10820 [Glaciihabitans arcticus]|uniref:Pilus assembly protein PilO n=1 Tax=Glaciihabitans arcticus TaxID=2668039 RepID=A0A4Q9GS68_9MICO|nr:hypothetical protein [Glaciihabitans arcticus]TBN57842.1 hypothetical protein EYE40_10820 [Glaciihabitans arcticus]
MNSNRIWLFGAVALILILLAGTFFLGVSPQLEAVAKSNTERETVESQNQVQQVKLAALKKQFEQIDSLRADLAAMQAQVPTGANLSPLIGQLDKLTQKHSVDVESVTFSDPSAYIEPIPVTTEDAVPVETDPELATAMMSVNGSNFFIIPVEIAVTGKYKNVMDFVDSLQKGTRLFLVHGLSLDETTVEPNSPAEMTISGQVFVLLDGAGAPPVLDAESTTTEEG